MHMWHVPFMCHACECMKSKTWCDMTECMTLYSGLALPQAEAKPAVGLFFAPKPRGMWQVMQRNGETQFVPEGDLISGG